MYLPDADPTDPLYPAEPHGTAHTFKRPNQIVPGNAPLPLFPGQEYQGFHPYFGNINGQLERSAEYPEYVGKVQNVAHDRPEGVNFHATDHWAIHPGDVNLEVGYYAAGDGDPRSNSDLVAAGPVTGRPASQFSGYIAMLRTPTGSSPGPVAGRTGADFIQSVQASNAPVLYSTQVADQDLYAAVFGAS